MKKLLVMSVLAAAIFSLSGCGNQAPESQGAAVEENLNESTEGEEQKEAEPLSPQEAETEKDAEPSENAVSENAVSGNAVSQNAVSGNLVSYSDAQSISMNGIGNARELGGYKSADGRTVKKGVFLRTAALSKATDEDIKRLKDVYNLSLIVDYRTDREISSAPDPKIEGVKNINLPILDEKKMMADMKDISEEELAKYDLTNKMDQLKLAVKTGVINDQMYVGFLSSDLGKENYGKFFKELLALPDGEAVLFHCTQGKDRTGCGAMLILSALDVDEDTIMADYELTNLYNAALIEKERQMLIQEGYEGEELESMMKAMDEVNPDYMRIGLDWVKENYGSVKGYITKELGVTEDELERFKDRFLE